MIFSILKTGVKNKTWRVKTNMGWIIRQEIGVIETRLTNTLNWGWKSSLSEVTSLLSGIFLGGDAVNLLAIGSSVKHAKVREI